VERAYDSRERTFKRLRGVPGDFAMARTESTMELALGTLAPDFALRDVVTGKTVRRDDFSGQKGLLVMFICTHCPYVKHVEKGLAALGVDYDGKGMAIAAISSNDADMYPDDGPEGLREQAERLGFRFPYLYDEMQDVAKAYHAACTPDFFLFDGDLKLAYRGQFDGSRPNSGVPVTGGDLRAAMDALLAGKAVAKEQRPSMGCNIKWKAGH
jgi:peroxiredoxin